jgi:glycosyltransferase involved in cell wall biosynthesis
VSGLGGHTPTGDQPPPIAQDHGEGGDRPWRLLIVVNVAWFFVMHRLPIALMARERGVEVHVACGEGDGADDVRAAGFPFHLLPLTRAPLAPLRDLQSVFAMARLYRKLRPDIVHHVTLKPVVFGSFAARLAGVPAVVNAFAGLGYVFSGTSFLARVRQRAMQCLIALAVRPRRQAVVFENHDDFSLLTSTGAVPRLRSIVISGIGVDTSVYHPADELPGTPTVLLASRMLREKGVEYFVEAARQLKARGVTARFVLLGLPDLFNPGGIKEDQLRKWSAEGVVEWLGFRRDMPRALQEAHIVCLPTYYREGVPRVLMEAAACGRPLVATDMPGCRDIVQHEINGLLVQPHDVTGLAEALERLIRDRDLRMRFGASGRLLAEQRFALSGVLEQFWELYGSLRGA